MNNLINLFQKKEQNENTDLSSLHFHNGYEFIFVTSGDVKMEIDCTPHKVKSSEIIMLSPFEQHKITDVSDDYKRIVIVINADVLEQSISPKLITMLKCRPQGFSNIFTPEKSDFLCICNALDEISDELNKRDDFCNQYILNCFYNILIIMYRTKNNINFCSPRLMQIQAYIDENYDKIDRIQDLALKYCFSLSHLSRIFKNFSGYSPVEYLKNTRLYHAQLLLVYSDLRVNEISSKVGFKETNNFIKQFKSKFGTSPNKFRKNSFHFDAE